MPRIRTIKPEFWQDEKLAPMTPVDRLVFLGLISIADDAGRLVDNVKHIDGFLFPHTQDSSRDSLGMLAKGGRILRYTSESGQRLIQIVNWERHQKVDHPSKYNLPAPPPQPPDQLELADTGTPERAPFAKPSRDVRDGVAPRSTTYDQRSTTDDHPSPRAREAFAERLDEPTLEVVSDFLNRLPATSSHTRWIALIGGWLDGLDIRPPVPIGDDLRIGLTDYLAQANPDFSPIHVRSFVERAARDRLRPTAERDPPGGRRRSAAEQSVANTAIALRGIVE